LSAPAAPRYAMISVTTRPPWPSVSDMSLLLRWKVSF
jgi:hypothetical protein